MSPAALNYSFGYLDERLRYEQTVVGYNTSGNIFDGIGAGPFSMAAGVEWRQEVGHNDEVSCPANDAACQARIQDFAAQFGTPFGGRVTVEEGYLEANLPLLKDRAWAHLLEVDVAGVAANPTTHVPRTSASSTMARCWHREPRADSVTAVIPPRPGGLSLTPMLNWVGHGTLNYAGVTPQQI